MKNVAPSPGLRRWFGHDPAKWGEFQKRYWAELEAKGRDLKHALLRAYFTEGRDVSDHATLLDVANSVGLPADRAREILASDAYADDVRTVEQFFLQQGIQGVPAVIIDRRHLISGGQPVEVFEQALRQIAAAKQE